MAQPLKFLIIHCTATPEGREVTSSLIRQWHTAPPPAGRGWKQVGYSKMIHVTGIIETLVPSNNDQVVDPWEITNGVAGYNSISEHIVYVGGMDKDNKAPKDTLNLNQQTALKTELLDQIAKHPKILIGGHNQFDRKACPSFDVPTLLRKFGIQEKYINTTIYYK